MNGLSEAASILAVLRRDHPAMLDRADVARAAEVLDAATDPGAGVGVLPIALLQWAIGVLIFAGTAVGIVGAVAAARAAPGAIDRMATGAADAAKAAMQTTSRGLSWVLVGGAALWMLSRFRRQRAPRSAPPAPTKRARVVVIR